MTVSPATTHYGPEQHRPRLCTDPTCLCTDPPAAVIAELVAHGWGQGRASLLVHTGTLPTPEPPADDAGQPAWAEWCAAYVDALTAPLRPTVGMLP